MLATVIAVVGSSRASSPPPAADSVATAEPGVYVGRAACASCHQREVERYTGSHHERSMQLADATTVLGDFDNATFRYNEVTSTFFKKGDACFVRTDGADGALHDYRIAYTLGIDPLQQYLVEFPDGRLQVLGIGWDARPKSEGGQRWFHLYADEKIDFRDVLHWTGPAQNWNYMCAECHSTNVRKNYLAEQDRFETTRSEVDVSCEACHGPGSKHVEWARKQQAGHVPDDSTDGLIVDLAVRGGAWVFEGNAPSAHLTGVRDTRAQIVCARCHARRTEIGEDYRHDQPLGQTHVLSLLDPGLYQADGQILDEVFEYGSFLQSRMHERGVVCTDCHDPHSGHLRAEGNTVCTRCHQPSHFDTPLHHHHSVGTAAARCVSCHMLARNYMVVHTRHDHSFRVPRPDLSVTLGTPNTCTDCHKERGAQWAAEAVVKWYGATRTRGPRYAAALAAGRRHQAGAEQLLEAVIDDRSFPPIVRATALSLLQDFPAAANDAIERALQAQEDPLVRRAAVSMLSSWPLPHRWQLGAPLLSDPIRDVRLAAVSALADGALPRSATPQQRSAFERAVAEYRVVQSFNADRAEAWLNLGALDARLGDVAAAEDAYQHAIRTHPSFMPAYINLADLYRQRGRDADGERLLRSALTRPHRNGDVHHALGLLLVRQKRMDEALAELAEAAEQSPDNPRYAYAYGVALDGVGRHGTAVRVLARAHDRFTGDRDILVALIGLERDHGDFAAALTHAEQLVQLAPRDGNVAALVADLRRETHAGDEIPGH